MNGSTVTQHSPFFSAFFDAARENSAHRAGTQCSVNRLHKGQPSPTHVCYYRSCGKPTARRISRPPCSHNSSNYSRRRSYCRRQHRHRHRHNRHCRSAVNNPSHAPPCRRSSSTAVLVLARSRTWWPRILDVSVLTTTTAVQRTIDIF